MRLQQPWSKWLSKLWFVNAVLPQVKCFLVTKSKHEYCPGPFTSMTATEQHTSVRLQCARLRVPHFITCMTERATLNVFPHTHIRTHTHTHTHTAVMLLVAHFSFWQDARQHTLYRLSVGLAAAVIPWMTQVREFFNFRISPLASILNSVTI